MSMFYKENDQYLSFGFGAGDWCTFPQYRNTVLKYLLKKMNPKIVKPCPVYGRYDIEKFTFGRQYFVTLLPSVYQFHFKLVDEATKAVFQSVLDFELIDH